MTEIQLAERIASEDHIAFETMMRRYNRLLYRTARAILRDDAQAEDALQLAYLHAYKSIGNFRGDARLSTWLTRIVANEAMMRLRQRKRESLVIPIDSIADADGNPDIPMDRHESERPESQAIRSQMRAMIERGIDALPETFRTLCSARARGTDGRRHGRRSGYSRSHGAHADLLAATVSKLGGHTAQAKTKHDFPVASLKNEADVLRFAAKLESGAISAYLGAVPVFDNRDLSRAAASIVGGEAMHWAILRQVLGDDSVPTAFVG